jgi:hypothetical protein
VADEFPNFSIYGLPFFHSGEVADWRTLAHRSLSDLQASGDGLPGASHPRVHS